MELGIMLLIIWWGSILILAVPFILFILISIGGVFVTIVAYFAEIYFKFIREIYRAIKSKKEED